MSIIIEPLGGLGNQLFVYATGRSLSIELGVELEADLRNFEGYEWHDYELDSFHNDLRIIATPPARRMPNSIRKIASKSNQAISERSQRFRTRVVLEKDFIFDPSVLKAPDGSRLRGYFQSPKYFEKHADLIRAEISQLVSPSNWFKGMSKNLVELSPWAAVHVRRGNYTGLPNMGLAGEDYYSQALELLRELEGTVSIVVFSDDLDLARTLLSPFLESEALYVEAPLESRPIESLLLMSYADHIIIGNSSFSWWSAWLGNRMGRRVICPRPWLDESANNDRDLIPAPWISLVRS
jgi:hypothetical protein